METDEEDRRLVAVMAAVLGTTRLLEPEEQLVQRARRILKAAMTPDTRAPDA